MAILVAVGLSGRQHPAAIDEFARRHTSRLGDDQDQYAREEHQRRERDRAAEASAGAPSTAIADRLLVCDGSVEGRSVGDTPFLSECRCGRAQENR